MYDTGWAASRKTLTLLGAACSQYFGNGTGKPLVFYTADSSLSYVISGWVYTGGIDELPMRFQQVKAPNREALTRLTHTIARRVGRYPERQGLVERGTGNIFLTQEAVEKVRPGTGREAGLGHVSDEDPSNQLLGS